MRWTMNRSAGWNIVRWSGVADCCDEKKKQLGLDGGVEAAWCFFFLSFFRFAVLQRRPVSKDTE